MLRSLERISEEEFVNSPHTPDEFTQFRLSQVESAIRSLDDKIGSAVGTLGGQLTAFQTQQIAFQQSLSLLYTPRPEAQERHRGIEEHFDANEKRYTDRLNDLDRRITEADKERLDHDKTVTKRIERVEAAGWAVAIGLLMAIGTALFSILKPG